jgi:hypothetical protein
MRSLRPELTAPALLLPKAPSDFVTANRTFVTDGDRLIPLVGIWRDDRFPDAVEQAKLKAVSDAIDEATGLSDTEHEAVAYSIKPKGVPAAALDAEQREMLRALLGTYFDRAPAGVSRRTATTTRRSLMPCISTGRDRPHRDSLTTTACKVRGC